MIVNKVTVSDREITEEMKSMLDKFGSIIIQDNDDLKTELAMIALSSIGANRLFDYPAIEGIMEEDDDIYEEAKRRVMDRKENIHDAQKEMIEKERKWGLR